MLSKEKQEIINEKFVEMLENIKSMDEYSHFLFIVANTLGAFVNGFPEEEKDNLMILIKNTIGGAKQL